MTRTKFFGGGLNRLFCCVFWWCSYCLLEMVGWEMLTCSLTTQSLILEDIWQRQGQFIWSFFGSNQNSLGMGLLNAFDSRSLWPSNNKESATCNRFFVSKFWSQITPGFVYHILYLLHMSLKPICPLFASKRRHKLQFFPITTGRAPSKGSRIM